MALMLAGRPFAWASKAKHFRHLIRTRTFRGFGSKTLSHLLKPVQDLGIRQCGLQRLRHITAGAASQSIDQGSAPEDQGGTGVTLENTVYLSVEGASSDLSRAEEVAEVVEQDAQCLLAHLQAMQSDLQGHPLELSVVLCDDDHIAELNGEYRGKEGPTDVLSFEADSPPGYPLWLLGDVVISVATALRQADERGHSLVDECRVLLVHGILHLLGYDHELGEQEERDMAVQEQQILAALGWLGQGLIAAAGSEGSLYSGERVESEQSTSSSAAAGTQVPVAASAATRRSSSSDVKLLALDMDGTLLDSQSKVLPSSVKALKAALAAGVLVCLATGKARPAAMSAMARVGLAGEGLVIWSRGPGLFLQGLAVHGRDGTLLEGPDMPPDVVRAAFEYAQERNVPLAAFLGDDCATLQMHPELEELHYRYYEPLCREVDSLEVLLRGPPVKKLLFMTEAESIAQQHQPFWKEAVQGKGADITMAVPNMLEVVPQGINKWVGMQLLLQDLNLTPEALMSCGDGSNDLQLVANSGLGIAMGNAIPAVKEAANAVVSSNDEHGIAEAIERFIL